MAFQQFPLGGDLADGEWVFKYYTSPVALTNLALNVPYVVDLVNIGYLPQDDYDYEIMLDAWMTTTTVAEAELRITVYNGRTIDVTNNFFIYLCDSIPRVTSQQVVSTCCVLPIEANKKQIAFVCELNGGIPSWNFNLRGYRRVGINV